MADMSTLRDEKYTEDIPQDLPEQAGGYAPTLLPAIRTFQLPSTLSQCWEAFDDPVWQDDQRTVPVMDPQTGKQKVVQRIRWKFDKDNPLVVVESPNPNDKGEPAQCSITNVPRKRSKKPEVPKVSDATYLIRESLGDSQSPLNTPMQWVQAMGKHAGEVFRAESGLSAFCSPQKTRYMAIQVGTEIVGQEDPSGQKGCGVNIYTDQALYAGRAIPGSTGFKLPDGTYADRVYCPKCQAFLRGFFRLERFLKRQ